MAATVHVRPRGRNTVYRPSECDVWFSLLASHTKNKQKKALSEKNHLLMVFPFVFPVEFLLLQSEVQTIQLPSLAEAPRQ